MIFVDSNVFVIALRYPRDRSRRVNQAFLDRCARRGDAVTSVINVLEVCGILSHGLNARQLDSLYRHFARHFGVRVVPRDAEAHATVAAPPPVLLEAMANGMSFGDALVADACRRFAPAATSFVSWDAGHFDGRVPAPAITPAQLMDRRQR